MFDEGTVLCLGDRTALGRVEEVFGPITAPLYALRYTGAAGAPPASAAAGEPVFTVDKYAAMLEPEVLQTTQVSHGKVLPNSSTLRKAYNLYPICCPRSLSIVCFGVYWCKDVSHMPLITCNSEVLLVKSGSSCMCECTV